MNLPESPDYLNSLQGGWEALGNGAPTLVALAQLCARAMVEGTRDKTPLSVEAKAILYAARNRGVIEVRGVNTAFEATARLLAVYIEEDEHRTIAFRNREQPQVTVRFFEAFCQLCRHGLVLHHLYRDFSLTDRGFVIAAKIEREEVAEALGEGTEFGLHD
ncbi:hypothetical protein EC9_06220 [Rosistilla ulvae]|uniref:Uncharacterized protein n=1 Tax=Rosistilla ulvae TaxID=1930277 RepID=A0A517LV16_9BACT|nr:hypothetical protein [Rosistilla ulvae]QDS86460.1 hypothetical protein EC9_06220 [Rosistilla ulvae]